MSVHKVDDLKPAFVNVRRPHARQISARFSFLGII